MITLYSSHGHATFTDAGELVEDALDVAEFPAESHPQRLDVAEWREHYAEDPAGNWDILDWGYWTAAGTYEPPVHEWRDGSLRGEK